MSKMLKNKSIQQLLANICTDMSANIIFTINNEINTINTITSNSTTIIY